MQHRTSFTKKIYEQIEAEQSAYIRTCESSLKATLAWVVVSHQASSVSSMQGL